MAGEPECPTGDPISAYNFVCPSILFSIITVPPDIYCSLLRAGVMIFLIEMQQKQIAGFCFTASDSV